MKIKPAIAQLCLKQDLASKDTYASDKHRALQEAINNNAAGLGGYVKPITEILKALTGYELTTPVNATLPMWSVIKDSNGNYTIIFGVAGGTSYGMMIPKVTVGLPEAYTQASTSHQVVRGSERATVLKLFLDHPCKDEDVVSWVSRKLGGDYIAKFLKDVLEVVEVS